MRQEYYTLQSMREETMEMTWWCSLFFFQENFAGNGRWETNIQQFSTIYALKDGRNVIKMLEIIIPKDNKKFVEPPSKYSLVMLHLYLITRILNENPAMLFCLPYPFTFNLVLGLNFLLAWENSQHLLIKHHYPDLDSDSDQLKICFIQSEALPRSG